MTDGYIGILETQHAVDNAYRQGQLDLIKRLEEWDCQGCRSAMEELGTVCPSCEDWRNELARLSKELEDG